MLRISQLKLPVSHKKEDLLQAISRKAGGKTPDRWKIVRRSLDARRKPDLYYIYTIDASFSNEKKILNRKKSPWTKAESITYRFPYKWKSLGNEAASSLPLPLRKRPVIVGAGPAGLFAGLVLARAGFCPVLFERGDETEQRSRKVEDFWENQVLDPESNVQFGEGGAGTFSDGKLNTLVKDRYGRNHFVLEEFVKHGAPEEILYDAKPHIGTDILKTVVSSIRKEILRLGGQVHFRTKVVELISSADRPENPVPLKADTRPRLTGLRLLKDGQEEEWPCEQVILAIGHSARDTFTMLNERQISMTPKAFAIGVRVEHPADLINESQYGGRFADLPAASYKLTHQCTNGRGIYSFCMCPGGYVVNSSSEPGRLCVNGMSYHGRDGKNSNSAIITTVGPEDFPGQGPLSGIEFQRIYESLAWQAGKGKIPVQLLGDFRENVPSTGFGSCSPQTKGAWQFANLRECLPDYIVQSLLEGMEAFGSKIRGYNRADTILSGVEARTSSPIRLNRDDHYESSLPGLFPCGEGAGYAGGITSAAMDGLKVAELTAKKILEMS